MAGKFPPIRDLGGPEAFADYQDEFEQRYHLETVRDVRGHRVRFGMDRCEHVCYSGPGDDRSRRLVQYWSQQRAERIPWIETTLRDPEEIRESHQFPGNIAYLLSERREEEGRVEWLRFIVIAKPLKSNEVRFITAFSVDWHYWNAAQHARLIYPKPKAPGR